MTKNSLSTDIIAAAKKEFQKRRYNDTSVENIIEASGVSADEFLECFEDKEACCKKVLKSYEKEVKNT
jgi:AcrR family transcriptional regulator